MRIRKKLQIGIGMAFVIAMLMCPRETGAQSYGKYAGVTACAPCHADIVKGWMTTRHAKAFDSLKKTNQETLPGCVKCHVTGFEQDGGFIDNDLTPELANVQCEQCHGAGKAHIDASGDKSKIIRTGGTELCRVCHTPGQDKDFDYEKKIRLVHGDNTAETRRP